MNLQDIRSYEVSVWTLQDSFLAVLKQSESGIKGTIQDPKFTLNTDGTQNFSFTIPMKLYIDGEWRDNPIWYNTTNGNLLVNMRKIKIIFNKKTDDEEVYECPITKMEMKHAQDSPTCEITCENGLAYHELGKLGYKAELSSDIYYLEEIDLFNNNGNTLYADLDYWCSKLGIPQLPIDKETGNIDYDSMDPRQWYYKVEMDWSSYSGNREKNKVYEDPHVASWEVPEQGEIAAKTVVEQKIKERVIDEKYSNLYNLTLNLATKFNIYCRYLYLYDDTYHIRGKVIIFYNNFLNETKDGIFQFLYPYTTTEVSREVDSTDIVTKMYIDLVDGNTATGQISIMNSEANKMREDYLLNFDYMHEDALGITENLYEQIAIYETAIRRLNDEIIPKQEELGALEELQNDLKAKLAVSKNAESLAEEEVSNISDLLNKITDGDGKLSKTKDSPDVLIVKADAKDNLTVTLKELGIDRKTVHIYSDISCDDDHLVTISKNPVVQKDNTLLYTVKNIAAGTIVYATYEYSPKLYNELVQKDYQLKADTEDKKSKEYLKLIDDNEKRIDSLNEQLAKKLSEKAQLVRKFELMMGPALREGHWTPEDYSNYGDRKNAKFTPLEISTDDENDSEVQFVWDKNYLPEELHNYYEEGINLDKKYYPVCWIGANDDRWPLILNNSNGNPCLAFFDGPLEALGKAEGAQYYKLIALGAGMEIIFIESPTTHKIIPAIMITESLTSYELGLIATTGKIGIPTWTDGILTLDEVSAVYTGYNWNITVERDSSNNVTGGTTWSITLYIPRILIKNLDLMTSEDKLALRYEEEKEEDTITEPVNTEEETEEEELSPMLSEYTDYSLLLYAPEGDITSSEIDSYAITLKELNILKRSYKKSEQSGDQWVLSYKTFHLLYYISNASTAIYLDAKTILKENAYPKVTYSLTPNVLNTTIHKNLYRFLARIININDVELKLHEAYGYISELELDLDHPWNDTITVQNYKNKFEDIFSTITVLTEAMQRREYQLNEATLLVDVVTKQVNPEMLQKTLDTSLLNYDFNDGQLTFDNEQGITGISSLGIIAIRSSGIFTASSKDEDGNWQWNSAIVPTGINANLIKAGLLDTLKILIYSGNDVKFLWNGDGIYAYKTDYRANTGSGQGGADEFVRFHKDGLFLTKKKWKLSELLELVDETVPTPDGKISPDTYNAIVANGVNLVEVSWNGFIMRNYKNDKVFEADPEGNLEVTGRITATSGTFNGTVYATNGTFNGTVNAINGDIGGWKINQYNISSAISEPGQIPTIILLSTTELGVRNAGIYASSGVIGGWNIEEKYLYSTSPSSNGLNPLLVILSTDTNNNDYCIAAGAANKVNLSSAPFSVTFDGLMHASSGEIGGWSIGKTTLQTRVTEGLNNTSNVILRGSGEEAGIYTSNIGGREFIAFNNYIYYKYQLKNTSNYYYYRTDSNATPDTLKEYTDIIDFNSDHWATPFLTGTPPSLTEKDFPIYLIHKYDTTNNEHAWYIGWTDLFEDACLSLKATEDPRIIKYGNAPIKCFIINDNNNKEITSEVADWAEHARATITTAPPSIQITIGTDDEQYTQEIELSKNVTDYITQTYVMKKYTIPSNESNNVSENNKITMTLAGDIPTFSLKASDGKVSIMEGQIGPFNISSTQLSGGMLNTNVQFKVTNKAGATATKSIANFKDCIVNAWLSGPPTQKRLVLVKLNGDRITLPPEDSGYYLTVHK